MWLTRFAISRPVITAMVFGALAIFGIISYFQLGRSNNPPGVEFPIVIVQANYPGASPQEMERLVIKPIEDQIDGIDGLDQVSATAQEGIASVVVQFKIDTNLDLAAIDVQRRVDTARVFMPSDLDPPYVYKNGSQEPLLDIAVSSKSLSPEQLADVVNNRVEPLLKQIPNIQNVNVYGSLTREFHVEPDPARLLSMNATLPDIFTAVAQNNANLPGGLMTQPTQETTVSVHAEVNQSSDLAAIPLPVPGQSMRMLKIGDVAGTYDSHIEQRTISHYNGQPRLYVELSRDINADEIKSTKTARDELKKIAAQFPQLSFHEIDAPADYTQAALNGVWQSLFEGIFLTAIVMLLFLHAWRNAAVVMIAIPTSILSTFVVMNLLGFHLDSMSLMGLSLIIGILVDDSIVVLENITRHRDLGQDPEAAAITGRTEIGGAAIAITMVDVVVFLPIAFLPGIVGKYLREYALVVVVATLFSLFVSFTLTPLLAAKWSVLKRSMGRPRWMDWFKNTALDIGVTLAGIALQFTPWNIAKVIGVFLIALVLLNVFVQRYDRILEWYRSKALPFGLAHGFFVVFVCAVLFFNAILLMQGGVTSAWFDVIIVAVLAAALIGGFLMRVSDRKHATSRNGHAPRFWSWVGKRAAYFAVAAAVLFAISRFGGSLPPAANAAKLAGTLAVLCIVAIAALPLGFFVWRDRALAVQRTQAAQSGVFRAILFAIWDGVVNLLRLVARSVRAFGTNRPVAAATFAVPIALALIFPIFSAISTDFVPSIQTGEISMTVTYPPGTPIATTSKYVDRLENGIMKIDGIKSVSSTVGRKPFGWGSAIGGNYAQLNATTQDDRRRDTNKIIDKVRALAFLVPGGKFQVAGDSGGGSGTSIFYSLSGPEDEIDGAAEKVAQTLRSTPGSVNVETSSEVAAPRLNVQIDSSKAAMLGVAPGAAALAARLAVDGAVATKVRTDNGLVDVRVQFPQQDRNTVQALQDVRVRAADGTLVPLADVATFSWTKAPTKIDRLNRQRVVNVFGSNLPEYSLGAVTGPLEKKLRQPGFLPPGVSLTAQGDTQYMMETGIDMLVALAMSFMLVYMLMVILYGSFLEPLIVMFSVPLAIIGALVALALMHKIDPQGGQSLNILSMLGIVMLFGLVSKNGILLVDYSNTLVRRGMRVRDAVLQAASTRFRPILMTTCAMVFGMLPLAIGLSEGAEWRQAMGTVIIGGLISSLILTLFLVPMIYNTWMGHFERRGDERAAASEMQPEPVLART